MQLTAGGVEMAHKRSKGQRAKARRDAVRKDDRVGATPETLAKLKPDPFNLLVERGVLDTAQRDAGLEINAIYAAITSFNRIKGGLGGTRGHEDMSDALAEAHAQIYVPWCHHWGRRVEHVIDLVYDRLMPEEIAINLAMLASRGGSVTQANRDELAGLAGRMLTDYARRVRAFRKIRRGA
jgi:hypothetical protein